MSAHLHTTSRPSGGHHDRDHGHHPSHNHSHSRIQIQGVHKHFAQPGKGDSQQVLSDVSLELQHGEFVCLLGASGCGKSTLLNLVAGFEQPDGGRLLCDGRPITGPGPERGMVFQQPTLFPWLTVRQNVDFGPRMAGRIVCSAWLAWPTLPTTTPGSYPAACASAPPSPAHGCRSRKSC